MSITMERPAVRIAIFSIVIAAVFGMAMVVGRAVGPIGEPAEAHTSDHGQP